MPIPLLWRNTLSVPPKTINKLALSLSPSSKVVKWLTYSSINKKKLAGYSRTKALGAFGFKMSTTMIDPWRIAS